MRSSRIFTILASFVASALLVAGQLQTIQQTIDSFAQTGSSPFGHSKCQALASKSGLKFDDDKNYTIFAPYNYAFPSDVSTVPKALAQYHVSTQRVPPQSGGGSMLIDTLLLGTGRNSSGNNATNLPSGVAQRLVLNYTNDPNVITLFYGQSNTTSSDHVIECTNGFIYFIVSALKLPLTPSAALQNNPQAGGLNDMGNDLTAATFNGQSNAALLNNMTAVTLFAVDNAAFASAQSSNNTNIANRTVLYGTQSVGVIAYTDYLATHSVLVNSLGETLNVTVVDGVYYINNVPIIYANIPTWNGVIHVVARLFDENTTTVKNVTRTTTPLVDTNTTTVVNDTTSAAHSVYASSATASILALVSASALFFVFCL